jgi:molybdate transport system regulatory protein
VTSVGRVAIFKMGVFLERRLTYSNGGGDAMGATRKRQRVELKLRVWVVLDGRVKLGDGRATLLQRIDELGSIKQAVAEFGMSYRNVWGYLRDLEQAAGVKLLTRQAGGGKTSGTRLTPDGRAFLARYWRFRRAADASLTRRFETVFGSQ